LSGRAAGCTCTWARGGTTRREARRPRRRPPPPVEAGGLRRPRSGSGGRWAPATAHAIPLAQGSVLAQLRRDGSPFGSIGQVAGRKPRRSRAYLACQQDIDEACRSWQGAACWFPGMRVNARPARRAAPSPNLYDFARCGVRKAAHQRALNRLSGAQRSERTGTVVRLRPGELAGGRAANRSRAPAADLASPLLACRQPTQPSAETTLHGCGRHKRRLCPPARLSSAHVQPAQPLVRLGFHATGMERPRRYRDRTPAPRRRSALLEATRADLTRPGRGQATPRPGGAAATTPAGRKQPATAAVR
jgi:hypothetical protein